jgi:hypothetical protein
MSDHLSSNRAKKPSLNEHLNDNNEHLNKNLKDNNEQTLNKMSTILLCCWDCTL